MRYLINLIIFLIFPNLVSNGQETSELETNIAFSTLELFDLSGRDPRKTTPHSSSTNLNLPSLKGGMYAVTIRNFPSQSTNCRWM